MNLKLYRVTCKGLSKDKVSYSVVSYSVATSPNNAHRIVRKYLDNADLDFSKDLRLRYLDKIELIAESAIYPDCDTRLYIQVCGMNDLGTCCGIAIKSNFKFCPICGIELLPE